MDNKLTPGGQRKLRLKHVTHEAEHDFSSLFLEVLVVKLWASKANFIGIQPMSKRGKKRERMELFSLDFTCVSGNLPKSFP